MNSRFSALARSRRRRASAMVLLVALLSIGLSSCTSKSKKTSSVETVKIAINGTDLANLNTQMTSNTGPLLLADAWSDGLYAWDGDGKAAPHLAKSWNISTDGLTYTFNLRTGVKWSDGQPFSSDDVVFTLTKISPLNTNFASVLPHIDSVVASDPQTVVIKLKDPYSPLFNVLNKETFPILPKHVYANGDIATNPANTRPVGLGPFTFQSIANGQSVTFVRNTHYWNNPLPYLDKIVFAIIPNSAQQLNSLRAGEIDISDLSYTGVSSLLSDKNVTVFHPKLYSPQRMSIDFNTTKGPLRSNLVRQALFMAIDRKQIVTNAYSGLAEPAASAIPPTFKDLYSPAVNYEQMYPYDPQKAKSILDQAGFPMKNGKRFSLDYTYITGLESSYPFEAVARIVAAAWKAIGVDVKLAGLSTPLWLDKVYSKRNFDVSEIQLEAKGGDPAFGVDRSFLCNTGNNQFTNPTGYCNPTLDGIIKAAASAPAAQRVQYYKQYEQIVANDLNELTLTSAAHYWGLSKKLGNLDKSLSVAYGGYFDFSQLKFASRA